MIAMIFSVLIVFGILIMLLAMFGFIALLFSVVIPLALENVLAVFLLGIACVLAGFTILFGVAGIYDVRKRSKCPKN